MFRSKLAALLFAPGLLLVVSASSAWASVTFDAAAGVNPSAGLITTVSWSHTIAATSKQILVYTVISAPASPSVSSVTVGAASATFQAGITNTTTERIELWALANPPTGVQTITVTWAASGNAGGASISFLGSDGTIGTPITGSGTTSPASVVVTSATGNLVSDGMIQDISSTCAAQTATPGAGQTQQFVGCTDTIWRLGESTALGAASVTMTWTLTGSLSWGQIGVDVHAAAAPSCTNFITLFGAGCQ
jgi:hypothetical protein